MSELRHLLDKLRQINEVESQEPQTSQQGPADMSLDDFANTDRRGLANDPQYRAAIRELQEFLSTTLGLPVSNQNNDPDEKYGPLTTASVRKYQSAVGNITADGDAGPETIASIRRFKDMIERIRTLTARLNPLTDGLSLKDQLSLLESKLTEDRAEDIEALRVEVEKLERFVRNLPESASRFEQLLTAARAAMNSSATTRTVDGRRETDPNAQAEPAAVTLEPINVRDGSDLNADSVLTQEIVDGLSEADIERLAQANLEIAVRVANRLRENFNFRSTIASALYETFITEARLTPEQAQDLQKAARNLTLLRPRIPQGSLRTRVLNVLAEIPETFTSDQDINPADFEIPDYSPEGPQGAGSTTRGINPTDNSSETVYDSNSDLKLIVPEEGEISTNQLSVYNEYNMLIDNERYSDALDMIENDERFNPAELQNDNYMTELRRRVNASGTSATTEPAAEPAAAATTEPAAEPAAAATTEPAAEPAAAPAPEDTTDTIDTSEYENRSTAEKAQRLRGAMGIINVDDDEVNEIIASVETREEFVAMDNIYKRLTDESFVDQLRDARTYDSEPLEAAIERLNLTRQYPLEDEN